MIPFRYHHQSVASEATTYSTSICCIVCAFHEFLGRQGAVHTGFDVVTRSRYIQSLMMRALKTQDLTMWSRQLVLLRNYCNVSPVNFLGRSMHAGLLFAVDPLRSEHCDQQLRPRVSAAFYFTQRPGCQYVTR